MALGQIAGNFQGGLLRKLQEQKMGGPMAEAGARPAMEALVQEPLSRTPPPGTSEMLATKPPMDWNSVEAMLSQLPPPPPEIAARMINAMISPPQGQIGPAQAPQAGRVAGATAQSNAPLRGAGPLLPGQGRVAGSYWGGSPVQGGPISQIPGGKIGAPAGKGAYAGYGTPIGKPPAPWQGLLNLLSKAIKGW